ncbi:MAG: hypothetical protein JWP35_37 [Caulobacter sp.]|nr:hypothetical protein [Caulobacter sp.]
MSGLAPGRRLRLTALRRTLALSHGARMALTEGATTLSFAEIDARAEQAAAILRARGVAPGDRVAILLPDGLAVVVLYLACAQLGAIATPLNWRLAAGEIAHILQRAAPRLLVTAPRFAGLAPVGAGPETLMLADGEGALHSLCALAGDTGPAEDDSGVDPFLMLFTSGTTGLPKGCVLGQEGQAAAALAIALVQRLAPSDRLLSVPPLFHVGGWSMLLAHWAAGASCVFAPQPLSADAWCDLIERHGCTSASLPPTLRDDVLARADLHERTASLRRLSNAGTTMIDRDRFADLHQTFGDRISVGYGLTEAGAFVAQMNGGEQLDRLDGCGRLMPHLEARILSQAGEVLATGSVGELALRGPSVTLGYWDDAAATAAALTGGWMKTGDLASFDAHGYLRFAGRVKELIKTGGENVYPLEVERVLMRHPGVGDCAVAGVPDGRWGEAVKAFIVPAPGAWVDPAAIRQWLSHDLAGYKHPRYLEFLDAIPRTALGKVERLALSQRPVTPEQAI